MTDLIDREWEDLARARPGAAGPVRGEARDCGRMGGFIGWFALAFLALMGLVALINRAVDPYDYWGDPRIPGVNQFKPETHRHLIEGKLQQYARLRPATIVAGNSRTEVGIDPDSAAMPSRFKPAYNLGLPGYNTVVVVDALERAIKLHKPRAIYLGVDFIDFRISQSDWRDFKAGAQQQRSAGAAEQLAKLASLTLSLDALSDSGATLLEQRAVHPSNTTAAGYSAADFEELVPEEGHAALFAQKDAEYRTMFLTGPKAVRWPGRGGNPNLAALERLAALCREQGIQLVIFTYPYHLDILRSLDQTGLWPAFADWKAMLADFSHKSGAPVWDFAHVDALSSEPIPARGDRRSQMRFYWESGHFKSTVGDQMMKAMTQADGFGGLIDSATIAVDHARLQAGSGRNGI